MSKRYRVVEKREVIRDLIAIAIHIEHFTGDQAVADRTVDAICEYLRSFREMPHRGTKRDDLRPGLRVVPFKRKTVIAFEVDDKARTVTLLRVFYGGQDYESVFR